MGFLRRGFFRRFPLIGRMTDMALVGSTAVRLAQRTGLVSSQTAQRLGSKDSNPQVSPIEMGMAAFALLRLFSRGRSGRRSR